MSEETKKTEEQVEAPKAKKTKATAKKVTEAAPPVSLRFPKSGSPANLVALNLP